MFTSSTPRMYARFHGSSSFRSFSKRNTSNNTRRRSGNTNHTHNTNSGSQHTAFSSSSFCSNNAMWRLRTSAAASSSCYLHPSSLPSIFRLSSQFSLANSVTANAVSSAASAMQGFTSPAVANGLVLDAQSLLLCAEEEDDGRLTGRRNFSTSSRYHTSPPAAAAASSASAPSSASSLAATTTASSSDNSPPISPVIAELQSHFANVSGSSLSSNSFSDVLDPSNPPLLALTHYQLLLSHVFDETLINRAVDRQKKSTASAFAEQKAKSSSTIEISPGESVKLAVELMENAGGEKVRDSIDFLNRMSDEELLEAMSARTVINEQIDSPSRPPTGQQKSYLDLALSDPKYFNPKVLQQSGENFEHLKRISAYAFLMRRRLAAALGLSRSDVQRIAESGRVSKNLFRVVEHELTPSNWRFIGLVDTNEINITSLGTLGSAASLAQLSANNEWQSAYYPRRLTSRANRHRYCRLCIGDTNRDPRFQLSYLNVDLLHQFINTRGKIIGRRFTRVCAKHQRLLNVEIKRARNIGLLAWLSNWKVPDEFVREFYGQRQQLKQLLDEVLEQEQEEVKAKESRRQHLGITDIDLGKQRPNIADELGVDVSFLRDQQKKQNRTPAQREQETMKGVADALSGKSKSGAAQLGMEKNSLLGEVMIQQHGAVIEEQDEEFRKMNEEMEQEIAKLKADALDPNEVNFSEGQDPFELSAQAQAASEASDTDTLAAIFKYRGEKGIEEPGFIPNPDAAKAFREEFDLEENPQEESDEETEGEESSDKDKPNLFENQVSALPLRTRESVLFSGRKPMTLTDYENLSPEEKDRFELRSRRRKFRKQNLLVGAVREKALGESLADEETERSLERLDEIYQMKGFKRDQRRTAFQSKKDVFGTEESLDLDVGKQKQRKADIQYQGQEFEKTIERLRKEDQKVATEAEGSGKKKK